MWVTHILSTEDCISTKEWQVKNISLVLVKRDMLQYVQDVRAVRGMGQSLSDHYVVLCNVRLVRTWIKSRQVVVGARRIRSEKLRITSLYRRIC